MLIVIFKTISTNYPKAIITYIVCVNKYIYFLRPMIDHYHLFSVGTKKLNFVVLLCRYNQIQL